MSNEQDTKTQMLARTNLVTCANALELGRKVIESLAGEGFVTEVDGEKMDRSQLVSLLAAKINLNLNNANSYIGA